MAYEPTEWKAGDVITGSKMNKIEAQLAANTEEIESVIPQENLFALTKSVEGYINTDGGVAAPGAETKERVSEYIAVTPGDAMAYQCWVNVPAGSIPWAAYCFYDSDRAKTGSVVTVTDATSIASDGSKYIAQTFTVPSGAAYIRVSFRTFGAARAKLEVGSTPTLYVVNKEDYLAQIVDQAYDGTSQRAQNGMAVKEAFTKEYVTAGRLEGSELGENATAEGWHTTASGTLSHAEGQRTTASGSISHAEGDGTSATAFCSHVEGRGTLDFPLVASGNCSHAEGFGVQVTAQNAHGEGQLTLASGVMSHAEGDVSVASGRSAHAQNEHTIANHRAQTALGRFNVADPSEAEATAYGDYAFIVGNGTSDTARSNAFAVKWDGTLEIGGVAITPAQIRALLALLPS